MIYICIPAYNEAPTIGLLLWKIRRVMDHFPRDYELLVMDDASTDGTQDVLEPYGRVLPLTVLRNPERRGYSASLERLLREAVGRASHPRRDVVVTLQADFSESPEEIPAMVKRVEGGVDVVGRGPAQVDPDAPRLLRWSRLGLPVLLRRAAVPAEAGDPLCGYRAYRVGVLKKAISERAGDPLLTRDGWAANVELLLAVAPHVRRMEAAEPGSARAVRRQRDTRFRAWQTLVQLVDVVRHTRRTPAAPTTTTEAAA